MAMAFLGLTGKVATAKNTEAISRSIFSCFLHRPEKRTFYTPLPSLPYRHSSSSSAAASAAAVDSPFSSFYSPLSIVKLMDRQEGILGAKGGSLVNRFPSLATLPPAVGALRDASMEAWARLNNQLWKRFIDFFIANYNPQHLKFPKQRRGTMKGVSSGGNNRICFGNFGLQALEPAWITSKQIEAGRRAMTQMIRRGGGKIWIRTVPHKSVSAKPTEVRMGRGKGGIKYWVAVVKPGKILYEVGGVHEKVAREAISLAASKMPIPTRFVASRIR
uniref:50S ribosomal protein L16, chloroplastic n=1 Tax=Rhizophora mucronata TaxID=61149 RepID=A0A2P2ITM0_RHIMU